MTGLSERHSALEELLKQRILILDGAMGTMLQREQLSVADFGGAVQEGCNENLTRTRPDVVLAIHRAHLAAGADIVETNTFGGTKLVLAEYGLANDARTLNVESARLARQAADEFSTSSKPRFVAGAMGPTTKAISVNGGVTFPQLVENFRDQAKALMEGGSDVLLLETCQDTRNVKAALVAIEHVGNELGQRVAVMISGTIEATGTMLAGQDTGAFYASVSHADLMSIGLNCATGPEFMTDHLRALSQMSRFPVSCCPNAGLPDEDGQYLETPQSLARQLERFVDRGWLNLVGGCCGTTEAHIRMIAQMADGKRPRALPPRSHRFYFSGVELLEAEESNRPLVVGERTNIIGSGLFRQLVAAESWDEATEIARRQMKKGAHLSDVCLQSADRDEIRDIPPFYEELIRKIRTPIMIDSTDPKAIELALTYCQGKSIINSINLEDGEERFQRVCPLAKRYGAALVVGCIDEDKTQAQAFTRERKLEIARRSYQLLTQKYGISPEDILIDPLVFPCATGDDNSAGSAVETIEAIGLVKDALPYVKTVLGISNVSFGLPGAARQVVNSVFLHHCTKAGLDLAIVNAEKLERFASIPEPERRLAENLLYNRPAEESDDEDLRNAPSDWRDQGPQQRVAINRFHIAAITNHFRQAVSRCKEFALDLPLNHRLANFIVEGTKDGLIAALDLKLAEGAAALDIINGPLMDGMQEVGRLFSNHELIVAEVLQSAEAMKAAVNYLERFLGEGKTSTRGKIILATVKGDVHDIGKNLVEIILANNGYKVVNLGIKISPEALISAYFEHRPDVIGLSGLLVKSAQQMAIAASDLKTAGIRVPLLVGGAALSEKFTRARIAAAYGEAACYAKDTMAGLKLMNQIMDPSERDAVLANCRGNKPPAEVASVEAPAAPGIPCRRSKLRADLPIPPAPFLDRQLRTVPNLSEVWTYINPYMLYGRHLGFNGDFEKGLQERDAKALGLYNRVEELKREAAKFMVVRAVWQYFEAERDGNAIHLFRPGGETPIHTFRFGRQSGTELNPGAGLCLSDYILDPAEGHRDHLVLYVVTAGAGIRERSEQWKQSGDFFKAHGIQALALETAQGCAEWLHRRIREDWGFPDASTSTMRDRFTSKYHGKRYSFGYPACPNLDDQQGIWKLLRPEEIGVELTEGMMMDPEASVSALVFHHPDCVYFNAYEPGPRAENYRLDPPGFPCSSMMTGDIW
jgi:5-methyltetrahydrofolate--homocysteine methyltransferase